MKTIVSTLVAGACLLTASSALAFTTWSTFEVQGYDVKARYTQGSLRYIKATNDMTGETFTGRVSPNGIATIDLGGRTLRININDAEKQIENRTTLQDLAQVQE